MGVVLKMKSVSVVFLALATTCLVSAKSYDNYKLIRTTPLSLNQALELQKWVEDYDFWRPARSGLSADIMVSPLKYEYLTNRLDNLEIQFAIVMEDVGAVIKSQPDHMSAVREGNGITFDKYYSPTELNAYID